MLRKLAVVVLALGLSLATFAQSPVQVVATSAVLADLAEKVGGERVSVYTIIPPGFCPAHFDLRPRDLLAAAQARLVLYHGMERWLETLLANVNPQAKVVKLPGPWNTPPAMIDRAQAIATALGEVLPEEAEGFATRAEEFASQVQALGEELLARAEELSLPQVPAIVMQWQAGFARWLGLNVVATYPPEERLSLRDLVELAAQGREAQALLVIDNLQSGVSFGARLARELSAVHVVLTNFPGALPRTADLPSMLRVNAEAIFSAVEWLKEQHGVAAAPGFLRFQ
ncbi:metal ABC transporter substrate-binding protein [Candidatus Bipolaricaulota bacterium]|nr:metal ABC transporter substrate-binding protein [Candidatus Bipolaricaulota bacterium]